MTPLPISLTCVSTIVSLLSLLLFLQLEQLTLLLLLSSSQPILLFGSSYHHYTACLLLKINNCIFLESSLTFTPSKKELFLRIISLYLLIPRIHTNSTYYRHISSNRKNFWVPLIVFEFFISYFNNILFYNVLVD